MNMNEDYISNQIAVYKNSKTLLEFQDKLKVAPINSYAHIHAGGETGADGRRTHSLIGILMKDYSKGTGDKAVTVCANISPKEAKFILSRLTAGFSEYTFQQDKIFGDKDEQGYAKVSKVRIIRATKDSKGAARKLPWYVEVENGKGVPQKNANGGTYMKPNSFVSTGKVYANLSDLDLFDLLSSVSSYIDCWEHAIAPALITKAKNAVAARQSSRNAA
ncbi:hypothetical protein D7X48_15635 [bacterium D16-50]|jgi:hypothetical protein|nr:hypothetical protein [uncultured Acetatifactor sp.]NBI90892.1 hypothetical protein [Lachnospiraceae bacterium]RKJ19011.1 hypothetical protein D7X48_15635 [bacterium D16-50]